MELHACSECIRSSPPSCTDAVEVWTGDFTSSYSSLQLLPVVHSSGEADETRFWPVVFIDWHWAARTHHLDCELRLVLAESTAARKRSLGCLCPGCEYHHCGRRPRDDRPFDGWRRHMDCLIRCNDRHSPRTILRGCLHRDRSRWLW